MGSPRVFACVTGPWVTCALKHLLFTRTRTHNHIHSYSTQTYFPHVVEPALGINRLLLAMFCDGLREEEVSPGDNRLVFHCAEDLAPTQILVLPLVKKVEQLGMAKSLWEALLPFSRAGFDSAGSIGKRYRRGDEDGVPLCATIDHDSPKDNAITLRDRDTMAQVRVPVQKVVEMAKAGNLKPSAFAEFSKKL